jgi:hypothetical protein
MSTVYSAASSGAFLSSSVLLLAPPATDYCIKSTAKALFFFNAGCKHYILYEGTEYVLPIKRMYTALNLDYIHTHFHSDACDTQKRVCHTGTLSSAEFTTATQVGKKAWICRQTMAIEGCSRRDWV